MSRGGRPGMDPIVLGAARGRWLLLLVVALCFVAAGVLMIASGDALLVGWMSVAFFGACAVVFVWQLLDRRPRIVIDDRGILDRTLRVGVIEWGDVEGAYLRRIQGNPFLCLELRDPEKYTARLSPTLRRVVALNRTLGFTDLSLNLTGVDVAPELVEELVVKELGVRARG
jgi:hypothetical protein